MLKIRLIDIICKIAVKSNHCSPKKIVMINSALKKNIANSIIENELSSDVDINRISLTRLLSFCRSDNIGNKTVSKMPLIFVEIADTKPAGRLYAPNVSTDIHRGNSNLSSCCVILLNIT